MLSLFFRVAPFRCCVVLCCVVFVFFRTLIPLLASEGSLKEQLERLPAICRFQYTAVAEYVLNIVDPVLASYQSAVAQFPQSNGAVSLYVHRSPFRISSEHVAILLGIVSKVS